MRPRAAPRLHLHSWLHHTVIAVALLGVISGFSQYAVTASLADVAAVFGANGTEAAEVGILTTTQVGIGLAVIRLASLGALPLASMADRIGRRRVMLTCAAIGLGLTALAAVSPSFWWFVGIVAIGRPLMSSVNAVGAVVASEQTTSQHRTKALALGIVGYAAGVGLVSVLRVPINTVLGWDFRGLFAGALVLLAALPFIGRLLGEPDRFVHLRDHSATRPRLRALTAVRPDLRGRLMILVTLTFVFNMVTGPVNTFVFFYAEGELGIAREGMAAAVIATGLIGPVGLIVGRWAADRLGRRLASILPQLLLAAAGVLMYSGTPAALFAGYWIGAIAQAAYGTAFGALSTEVFPTSNRATAQGWLAAAGVLGATVGLVVFGAVTDAVSSFVAAALVVCIPCAVMAAGYLLLPETRGQELEESAPELGV